MVKKVKWNPLATEGLNQIATYLETEVSYERATRFVNSVYEKIDVLKKYPDMGRPAPNTKTIRFVKIDKNLRMYHRKNGTTLYIVWFFDTRQDPNKNRYG